MKHPEWELDLITRVKTFSSPDTTGYREAMTKQKKQELADPHGY